MGIFFDAFNEGKKKRSDNLQPMQPLPPTVDDKGKEVIALIASIRNGGNEPSKILLETLIELVGQLRGHVCDEWQRAEREGPKFLAQDRKKDLEKWDAVFEWLRAELAMKCWVDRHVKPSF